MTIVKAFSETTFFVTTLQMQNPFADEAANRIIACAVQGEACRGDNGAVMVDTNHDDIVYLLSHEIEPRAVGEALNELLSEDERKHVFVVQKTSDNIHILKIPRGFESIDRRIVEETNFEKDG